MASSTNKQALMTWQQKIQILHVESAQLRADSDQLRDTLARLLERSHELTEQLKRVEKQLQELRQIFGAESVPAPKTVEN